MSHIDDDDEFLYGSSEPITNAPAPAVAGNHINHSGFRVFFFFCVQMDFIGCILLVCVATGPNRDILFFFIWFFDNVGQDSDAFDLYGGEGGSKYVNF